jgi:hypothetical protein
VAVIDRTFLARTALLAALALPSPAQAASPDGAGTAQAGAAGLSQQEAVARFALARDAMPAAELRLAIAKPGSARDIAMEGGTLVLPAQALALARSGEELSGLYVVALALSRSAPAGGKRKTSLEEWLLAGAVMAAGETADPIREGADRNQLRNYDAQAPAAPRGRPDTWRRAQATLAAMARTGTCTGPALAYLDRLARSMPSPTAGAMARRLRADLGPLAYPAEERCTATAGFR